MNCEGCDKKDTCPLMNYRTGPQRSEPVITIDIDIESLPYAWAH